MPTSAKPKPRAGMARTASAFLSKPAASPTGLGKLAAEEGLAQRGGVHQVAPGEGGGDAGHRLGGAQGAEAEPVAGLGIEPEEQAAEGGVDGHGGGIVPSACQDGTGLTLSWAVLTPVL